MEDIRGIINKLDKSKEISDETKELMETLYLLAEQKANIFLMEMADSINKEDGKKLPVTALIDEEKLISVYVKEDVENLEEIIDNLLGIFIKHNKEKLVERIKKTLITVLKSFFGSSIAKSDSMEKYYVLIDGYSAIRIDIKTWFRSVESTSLTEYCEKILCVAAIKSVVDLSKIDISTFMYFYQDQLMNMGIKGQDLEQEMDNIRKIYDKFKQDMNS